MRPYIIFLLSLFSFGVNSQKYFFDILTIYKLKSNISSGKAISYVNSNDDTYILRLKKTDYYFEANLFDFKTHKNHKFTVIETYEKNEIIFNFKYVNTFNLNNDNTKRFKNYVFEFQTIEVRDSIKTVKLNVFKNSKKRKPIIKYELEIKNTGKNLFHAFRTSCLHPFESFMQLNFENGLPIKAKGNTLSGFKNEIELETFKKTPFELEIVEN